MSIKDTEQEIETYLSAFKDDALGILAQQLRSHLKQETNPSMELVADSRLSVNIGYGFTEKAWDCYIGIIVYSKHINLSFPSGATLSDPQSLLQGTGSRVRHIRINTLQDVKAPAVADLLAKARANAFALAKGEPADQNNITTIINKISGKKKRPN